MEFPSISDGSKAPPPYPNNGGGVISGVSGVEGADEASSLFIVISKEP